MTDLPINNDFIEISECNYSKLSKNLIKEGYIDGISDGRDSTFQRDFDVGFKQGLSNGLYLGNHHCFDLVEKLKNGNLNFEQIKQDYPVKLNPSRGHCVICDKNELINENLIKIIELQNEKINKIKTKFSLNKLERHL